MYYTARRTVLQAVIILFNAKMLKMMKYNILNIYKNKALKFFINI